MDTDDNSLDSYPLKEETYEIIGICMAVHNELGHGFLEIVYKDAIEIELDKKGINYQREKEYPINYKGVVLNPDFAVELSSQT